MVSIPYLPDNKTMREIFNSPLHINESNLKTWTFLSKYVEDGRGPLSFKLTTKLKNLLQCTYTYRAPKYKSTQRPSNKGILSTSSIYNFLTKNNDEAHLSSNNFTWIWSLKCPNKIKHFIWKCQHGRIPTRDYLSNLGIEISMLFHLCNTPKTNTHIFQKCDIVKKMWLGLGLYIQ